MGILAGLTERLRALRNALLTGLAERDILLDVLTTGAAWRLGLNARAGERADDQGGR